MTKLRLLTDGLYPDCEEAVGKVVNFAVAEFDGSGLLTGYCVPVTELRRIGCTLSEVWQSDDTLYWSLGTGCFYSIECEVIDE